MASSFPTPSVAMLKKNDIENHVLSCLPTTDLNVIRRHLEPVDLPVRTQLERANRKIKQVHFLDGGIASVVAMGPDGGCIEVGMIGKEGMTGLPLALGANRSVHETFMHMPGYGYALSAEDLEGLMTDSPRLRRCLLLYAHVYSVQAAQSSLANGRAKLEERLARWLLMAQDRIGSEQLDLTHEFLSCMLGVRRPGVSTALKLLESQALIQRARGRIHILDREGLEAVSNGYYGVAEAELKRLFG